MKMIDVGDKERTSRVAVARAELRVGREAMALLRDGKLEKGDALSAARVASILAAKKTPDLLPLCHPIVLAGVECQLAIDEPAGVVHIETSVHALERTGVEMEALTAASAAALTLYDMLKRHDRGMEIVSVRLVSKTGGRTGDWHRPGENA
jgi:cyclic pyranopterin phosphate synthase